MWSFDQTAILVRCAGLAGAGLDLDDAVGDLGHLELEQPLDETGVGAADDDLGALGGLADLDDVGLDPGAGLGALVGHLLGLGQQRLDPAEVEQRVAGVGLLDDAGDDVALAAGVLLVLHLALGLADALGHHLLRGLRGDATEVVGRDVELVADGLAVLVELLGDHPDLAGVGVDRDPGVLVRVGHALVGRLERVGERAEQRVDRDAPVGGQRLQRVHHVGIRHDAFALFVLVWFFELVAAGVALGSFADGRRWPLRASAPPHSNTVRAFSMSS